MFFVKKITSCLFLFLAGLVLPLSLQASGVGQIQQFQKLQEDRPADKRFSQYFRQLQQSPRSATAHLALANLYFSQNLFELAQESFRRALILDKNLAAAHQGLSQVYRKKKLKPLELFELQQAVAVAPNQDQYRYELGVLLMEPATYNYKAAKKQYKVLQKMNSPLAAKLAPLVE